MSEPIGDVVFLRLSQCVHHLGKPLSAYMLDTG
jgi:hypothetical protein